MTKPPVTHNVGSLMRTLSQFDPELPVKVTHSGLTADLRVYQGAVDGKFTVILDGDDAIFQEQLQKDLP